jgi:hypothetical protein
MAVACIPGASISTDFLSTEDNRLPNGALAWVTDTLPGIDFLPRIHPGFSLCAPEPAREPLRWSPREDNIGF